MTTYIRVHIETITRGYKTRDKTLVFSDTKSFVDELVTYIHPDKLIHIENMDREPLLFLNCQLNINGSPGCLPRAETLDSVLLMFQKIRINQNMVVSICKFNSRLPHLSSDTDASSDGESDND